MSGRKENMTLRERIMTGECVSELTCERCPVCSDHCQASDYNFEVLGMLKESGIEPPNKD